MMKLTGILLGCLTTSLLSVPALCSPLKSARDIQIKQTSDRFVNSDLTYADWSNKMVSENKMYKPVNSTTLTIHTTQGNYDLKNVVCGFLASIESTLYSEGETKFCGLLQNYVSAVLLTATYILQDGLCGENEDCTMLVDISMGIAGSFTGDGIVEVCPQIFEAIYNDCNGNVGGTAELTFNNNEGQQTGTVEADFYPNDQGAVCPVITHIDVCGSSSFS